MGESVCLLRSFSQPAEVSSRETNEVIPHRVLTESVSFGRFASESLQWEKWSAFTQNRYLEEVERFTIPGSVAQKKAFFEAHFKNRATGRTTKTKIQEANVKTSDESECQLRKDSQVPLMVNNGVAMNEIRHEELSKTEMDSIVPLTSVMDETTDVQTDEYVAQNLNLNSMAAPENGALDEEKSTSLSKERRSSSSIRKGSKLEPSSCVKGVDISLKKTRKEPHSSSKKSISVSKNQNKSPLDPFHLSISCASSGSTDKNTVRTAQNGSRSSTKAKKKKRSGPSSVLTSLNFASSSSCQTTKAVPKDMARNFTTEETTSSNARNSIFRNENEPTGASKSRKRVLPRTSKESSKVAKCSTSASSDRLPKLPPPSNRLPIDKRKNITTGSSVSGRIPNNEKSQSSAGSENLSTHCRARAKSFTISSPFNFRSDERAEKRKEFFKKLEEKNKKEDTGKEQLSCGFKANRNTHFASKEHKNPQVGGFQVPLINLTSPRFHKNQTPRTENIKKSHQTPHKVSSEKHKHCKIHPSQTRKKTRENSSPNILQN